MAEVTQPGLFHTAGSAHLEGIDLAGKTGTAQVVGHDTSGHAAKGHAFVPNVWFVGVTPRRNPELVVAVLWQNGGFSYYPARIGAQIVSAYVEKKRRLENNLLPVKAASPVEVSAIWTALPSGAKNHPQNSQEAIVHTGHFFVDHGRIVAASRAMTPHNTSSRVHPVARMEGHEPPIPSPRAPDSPAQLVAALPSSLGKGE
jgi:membrane peptidoglycan carboxypeptidase